MRRPLGHSTTAAPRAEAAALAPTWQPILISRCTAAITPFTVLAEIVGHTAPQGHKKGHTLIELLVSEVGKTATSHRVNRLGA
jgi:hypothetical protein